MKTYWSAAIYVDDRCVMISGGETLPKTLSRMISDCVYYQAIYPQSRITIREIQESCACHNIGTVTRRGVRSSKQVRCPECKGRLAHGKLDDIAFTMPDSANQITLFQADSKENSK